MNEAAKINSSKHNYSAHFNSQFPGQPGQAGHWNVKSSWLLLQQEMMEDGGGSGDSQNSTKLQTVCHYHHNNTNFYRLDALPVAQSTVSMH